MRSLFSDENAPSCSNWLTAGWQETTLPLRWLRNERKYTIQYWADKSKIVPVLNSAPRHAGVWGSSGTAPCSFNISTGWRRWSASQPGWCDLQGKEITSDTCSRGGWVCPRFGLGVLGKRKVSGLRRKSNYDSPVSRATPSSTYRAVRYGERFWPSVSGHSAAT